jgi:O-antigen/teichoic acid export membrane protein
MRRQATWLLASRTIAAALQAILLILLARELAPRDFGILNATIGVLTFIGVVIDFGLTAYSVKAYSIEKSPGASLTAMRLIRIIAASFVGLGLIVASVGSLVVGLEPAVLGLGILIWVALEKVCEAEAAQFIARQMVVEPAISTVLRRGVSLGLYVTLTGLLPLTFGLAISLVAGSAVGYLYINIAARRIKRGVLQTRGTIVLRAALPFGVSSTFAQTKNLDFAVVSLTAGAEAAGGYAAASRLAAPLLLLTSAIATAVMPSMGSAGPGAARQITRILIFTGLAGILVSLGFLPISGWIMATVFGPDYAVAGPLFVVVMAGTVLNALQSPLSAVLQGLGDARVVAIYTLAFGVALIVLIGCGGVLGGAFGAGIGYLVAAAGSTVSLARIAWIRSGHNL